jgi:hypothetical protein
MALLLFALFRAGLSRVVTRDYGPSQRIEGRSVFSGGTQPTQRLKTGADWRRKGNEP